VALDEKPGQGEPGSPGQTVDRARDEAGVDVAPAAMRPTPLAGPGENLVGGQRRALRGLA